MGNKIIGIVVARNTSRRFPGKHLEKVGNKTFLEILFDRFKKVENIDKIVLSTTRNKSDNALVNLAKKNKINFFKVETMLLRGLLKLGKNLMQK